MSRTVGARQAAPALADLPKVEPLESLEGFPAPPRPRDPVRVAAGHLPQRAAAAASTAIENAARSDPPERLAVPTPSFATPLLIETNETVPSPGRD
jgi:hypothetical protein